MPILEDNEKISPIGLDLTSTLPDIEIKKESFPEDRNILGFHALDPAQRAEIKLARRQQQINELTKKLDLAKQISQKALTIQDKNKREAFLQPRLKAMDRIFPGSSELINITANDKSIFEDLVNQTKNNPTLQATLTAAIKSDPTGKQALKVMRGIISQPESRGYTTLQDVVIGGKTYKVPFDHREGKYKWNEKLLLSPKTPSQKAAVKGAEAAAKEESKIRTIAKIDLPKVESNAEYLKTLIDQAINHPGFAGVVGVPSAGKVLQYVSGSDEAGFLTIQKQIEGKQFMQAYETLKGGGQITEIEGRKATEALSRLRTSVSEEEYRKNAEEFKKEIDRLTGLAKERADGKELEVQPKFKEGQTATNPSTGEKIIFRNGQWQSYQ